MPELVRVTRIMTQPGFSSIPASYGVQVFTKPDVSWCIQKVLYAFMSSYSNSNGIEYLPGMRLCVNGRLDTNVTMNMLSSDLCHLEQKSASRGVHLLQIVALTLEMQKFGGPP